MTDVNVRRCQTPQKGPTIGAKKGKRGSAPCCMVMRSGRCRSAKDYLQRTSSSLWGSEEPAHQAQGLSESFSKIRYARDIPIAALNQNRTVLNMQTVHV